MQLVRMNNVLKKFGGKAAVDHLHLLIGQGEIYGLVGPNGAGKSTTIKMMCGLIHPEEGSIEIDQLSVTKQPLEVKQRIGVVPQDIAVFDTLTAEENVDFFGKLYGIPNRDRKRKVHEALHFVGLSDRRNDKPKTYSGGMKRRLNIACSIVHNPKLIIMDEPTVGIDPQSRNHILESVRELNRRGTTVIYTSHYMEEVSSLCSRIGIMDHGRLVAEGSKEELRLKVEGNHRVTVRVQSVVQTAIEKIRKHPQVKEVIVSGQTIHVTLASSESYVQDIMFILFQHQVIIKDLSIEEPDLEKMFLSLTGQELRD